MIAAVNAPCVCTDPEADKLRELIAGGMGQVEASRLLWGPKPDTGTTTEGTTTA